MEDAREQKLVELVLEKAPAERPAFLDAVCGADAGLRGRVEALLAAREHHSEFRAGEAPTASLVTLPDESVRSEEAGAWIGRYRLLEKLGEGGFGSVWAAEQREPVRRRVALKIIKLGMDTRQVVARFEAERQALAMMDHPNIAKVLDAGATETGRPFFVMELVKGVPITRYCDHESLDIKTRLGLFTRVCQAIQHAHQKGIIHRDIKPSNIMVTLHDGVPVPKVIDFGIAKATQQELTEKTIYTQYSQFIGTPAYMSPEQAELSGLDIDTRSDIYSLGVLLYELLTGFTPFETKELMGSGLDAMRRIIREREPVRPSTRVSQTLAESSDGSIPKVQLRRLPTDLDWIVMKCLEKDRTRRYDTANGLAMDIERHLNDDPIVARPPSPGYRFQRFARRNRAALITAGGLLLLILSGAIVSGWFAVREYAARQQAEQARQQERLLNFRMAFDRGLDLCEEGHVGSGMLWMARALELAPDGEDAMERVIRANLHAWSRELHSLQAIYPHDHAVMSVAYSPDGERVVCGTYSGAIQMWDRKTGLPVGAPLQHENVTHEIVFTTDGSHFLTSSYDGRVKLWEADSRHLVRTYPHDSEVYGLARLPDDRFVTSTRNGSIHVWELDGVRPLFELPKASHSVHDLSLSFDGRRIVAACHNGEVILWDLPSKSAIARFVHLTRVATAAFASTDGNRIVTGDLNGAVSLWEWDEAKDQSEGRRTGRSWKHRGGVHRVRVSPDGSRMLTASFDNQAQFLDANTGEPIGVPFEHRGAVQAVAFGEDGSVLTACDDNMAREWRPARGSLLRTIPHSNPGLNEVSYSANGRHAMTWQDKETAIIHRAETGTRLGRPLHLGGGSYFFAVSPDETRLIAGSKGEVRVWDLQAGEPVGEGFPQSGMISVAVSPDGLRMVSGGFGGVIQYWDSVRGRPLGPVFVMPGNSVRGIAFHPLDRSLIAAVFDDKIARVIDVDAKRVIRTFAGHLGVTMDVRFSPDGKSLMTGSFDNTVRLWDVDTGKKIAGPFLHDGPFWYHSNFHPDGRRIVTACDDGTVRVWDVATAKPIGPRLVHEAAPKTAAFTAGGSQIVSGTATGITRFWSIPTKPLAADVEHIRLWLEVGTGMELNAETRSIEVIEVEDWKQRRRKLETLGEPPVRL